MAQRSNITFWGLIFVSLFSLYYAYLSQLLPTGAGPDEKAHLSAAQFIYENDRLAVYPQDKDNLYYSIFGATRSFRPPLIYLASAQIHQFADALNINLTQPFRLANALAGGLCALFLLLSLYCYTSSKSIAITLTAACMLMPQVSFIFSYLNADGPAIMACALILLSISLMLRNGINWFNLAFFGICCGVLSLCKITAWVFCFPVCLYALMLIIKSENNWIKSISVVVLCFAITAGWRIAFNIQHHGIENPFNWKLDSQINLEHAKVNLDNVINYGVQGKSYPDLLSNYDNFLTRTFLSFVGQLDWLRLRVGLIQYGFYALFLLIGFFASTLVIIKSFFRPASKKADHYFELSILAGCLFLFFLYMRFNINNDIQTQGKYILPAFPGFLLILAAFLHKLYSNFLQNRYRSNFKPLILSLSVIALAFIHLQAMYKYVIPFYYSNAYVDTQTNRYQPIDFRSAAQTHTGDLKTSVKTNELVEYKVTGTDPRLYIKDLNIDLNPDLILLRITVDNSHANYFYFYWDSGQGMSEQTVVRGFMPKGKHTVYQILPVSSVKDLRFDLGKPNTTFTIYDLSYAQLIYKPLIPLLNKIFNFDTVPAQ